MEIIRHIITPNFDRKPFFKSGEMESDFKATCENCHYEMVLSFKTVVGFYNEKESELTEKDYQALKKIYRIGYVGKSQDGGWPFFKKISCAKCTQSHVLYLGIQESVNSCLHITIQGLSLCK